MITVELSGTSIHVSANGLRHHVLRYGSPDGRDLLILPGITSPAATADFVAAALAHRGFHVIVPDIRGRGLTQRAEPGAYRMTDYATDAAALIDALELHNPVVLGHSMGARIAVRWAVAHATDGHGPVVAVDPPTSGPDRGPYPTTRQQFLDQLHEAQTGTTLEEVARVYSGWPHRELQIRADYLATCDETAVVESHHNFETEDFFDDWKQLTNPAVLVRGGNSPVVPERAADDLHRTNASIDLVTVPDAGHMVMWDNENGFWDAIDPYLDRALPPDPSN